MTPKLRLLRIGIWLEEVSRIQRARAAEVENVPVDLVRARFCYRIDLRTREAAVLCAVGIGLNLEFLNGVQVDACGDFMSAAAVIVNAVEHDLVRAFDFAGDGKSTAAA